MSHHRHHRHYICDCCWS